jgi:hypothetical protein
VAARALGVASKTLYKWAQNGHFVPVLRLGDPHKPTLRIRVTDLEQFLKAGEVSHAS